MSYRQEVIARFKKNKVAMFALFAIVLITLIAFIGPLFSPYAYDQQIRGSEYLKPCLQHPFGTDNLGRDMFVRTMIGTRITLLVSFFCALFSALIGTAYGYIAGHIGGKIDGIMMRICKVLNFIPDLLLIIILRIALGDYLKNSFPALADMIGITAIVMAFALVCWVKTARMVREQFVRQKQKERASRVIGIMSVASVFQFSSAIFTESFFGFIGIGASLPAASLGTLASAALKGIRVHPYLVIFPTAMIALILLLFNTLDSGVRYALELRTKSHKEDKV